MHWFEVSKVLVALQPPCQPCGPQQRGYLPEHKSQAGGRVARATAAALLMYHQLLRQPPAPRVAAGQEGRAGSLCERGVLPAPRPRRAPRSRPCRSSSVLAARQLQQWHERHALQLRGIRDRDVREFKQRGHQVHRLYLVSETDL